jgi:hypothetical protein
MAEIEDDDTFDPEDLSNVRTLSCTQLHQLHLIARWLY